MIRQLLPILFYLLAIIHILPTLSGLSRNRLAGLYGISADDKTLMTLLQHRAFLFGLVATACIYVAHNPAVRWSVLIGTVISMGSFILIAIPRGQLSGPLSKIAYVDGLGLIIATTLAVLLVRS